jgi:hypothetical protein
MPVLQEDMSTVKSITPALLLLFGCSALLSGQSRAAWMQETRGK